MYSCDKLFLCSLECYFGVYFPCCFATQEINTKITILWVQKKIGTRVHALFSIYSQRISSFHLSYFDNSVPQSKDLEPVHYHSNFFSFKYFRYRSEILLGDAQYHDDDAEDEDEDGWCCWCCWLQWRVPWCRKVWKYEVIGLPCGHL